MVEMVAKQVMRPHSRFYDEHEHEYPKELEIMHEGFDEYAKRLPGECAHAHGGL